MMGGERDKQTAWWCNDEYFNSFNLACTKDHTHKEWTPSITADGVYYPTKEEAEYPPLLCKRVTALVVEELERLGLVRPETFTDQIKVNHNTAVNSVAMGILPRGQKLRPLVSEFSDYLRFAVLPHFNADKIVSKELKGARITHRKLLTWGELRVSSLEKVSMEFLGDTMGLTEQVTVEVITIGIPREPWDFVKQAAMVGHPRFLPYAGTQQMNDLVSANLNLDTGGLLSLRAEFFNKWLKRAQDLTEDERTLHDGMCSHVKQVLHGKRLLLLREILEDLDYPDKKLFEDIVNGFKLAGWMRDSRVFTSLPRPPRISLEALLKSSAGLQHATIRKVVEPEDSELHAAAWEETKLEQERGWIWSDDSGVFKEKIIAHRFGIRQGDKVRVIDNFKQCGLNDACGLPEKFVLHGVDYIAATLIRALVYGQFGPGLEICGKTFDLKSAYKQYPIHRADRDHLRIAILDPQTKQPRLFGLNALPFGATGSVAGFLRVSSALFFILTVGLKIWCSAFFDDFPTLAAKALSDNTERCVGLLFDLLGIQYAQSGKKCQAFSEEMRALGLVFDLSQFGQGRVFIKHTPERKRELIERLEEILNKGSLTPKEAESLKGRIQWYESYLFGRIANLAVHRIGKRALSQPASRNTKLDAELKAALFFLKERVHTGLPLELTAETENALLVFSDGAFESALGSGSVGGILFDDQGTPLRFFAEQIPDLLMGSLMKEAVNPIYLIELLAAYLAVFLWGGLHPARYVVSYIDNEASRLALIKAYSSTELGNVMVRMFIHLEDSSHWKIWFGRVGSHSNPSDAPSRMQVEDLLKRGVTRDSVAWDVVIMSYKKTLHMLGRG